VGAVEPRLAVAFYPDDRLIYYKGDGGTSKRVETVEFWTTGRPPLRNRMIGSLVVSVQSLESKQPLSLDDTKWQPLVEAAVAHAVLTMNDDAAVPLFRSGSPQRLEWTYRVVKYVAADESPDTPVEFDEPVRDADGHLAPNGGTIVSIQFRSAPDLKKYLHGHGSGHVLVHFCVGVDGALTDQPKIIASTNPRLDDAVIRMINEAKLLPGTISGRPIKSCKDLTVTFRD